MDFRTQNQLDFTRVFGRGVAMMTLCFYGPFKLLTRGFGLDLYAENQISKLSLYCFKVWEQ